MFVNKMCVLVLKVCVLVLMIHVQFERDGSVFFSWFQFGDLIDCLISAIY